MPAEHRGPAEDLDHLIPVVYEQLRRIAHRHLEAEPDGHTLGTTALVHEAYLRLADQRQVDWSDRVGFFALAARSMRRVLVDYARRHRALRRGGLPGGAPATRVSLDDLDLPAADRAEAILALDEALERLERFDEGLARVVECRFFAGLTEAETAEALGRSVRSVARDWAVAKGWLRLEVQRDLG